MTYKSQSQFKDIIMYLSILKYLIKSRSKANLFDTNKGAETFFITILNIIYGYDLINLNKIQYNYPAIDLGDKANGVCIQVTSSNDSNKIKDTIDKFIQHDLFNDYKRLIILVLSDKKNYTTEFITQNVFTFSKDSDIIDIDDLLKEIEELVSFKLNKLHAYIKDELSTIANSLAPSDSLLAYVEQKVNLPPLNGTGLLTTHLEYKADEIEQGYKDLINFYEKLSDVTKDARGLLLTIVEHGDKLSRSPLDPIHIDYRKLENILKKISPDTIHGFFKQLENAGIASVDEYESSHCIQVYFNMNTGVELIQALQSFSEEQGIALKSLIVECDFTLLDES